MYEIREGHQTFLFSFAVFPGARTPIPWCCSSSLPVCSGSCQSRAVGKGLHTLRLSGKPVAWRGQHGVWYLQHGSCGQHQGMTREGLHKGRKNIEPQAGRCSMRQPVARRNEDGAHQKRGEVSSRAVQPHPLQLPIFSQAAPCERTARARCGEPRRVPSAGSANGIAAYRRWRRGPKRRGPSPRRLPHPWRRQPQRPLPFSSHGPSSSSQSALAQPPVPSPFRHNEWRE